MIYRGWRVIPGGLGKGTATAIGPTASKTSGTTTTGTTLPARGAQYQTVVPTRTGGGLTTQVPAGRGGSQTLTQTPTCAAGTYWDAATGVCIVPGTTPSATSVPVTISVQPATSVTVQPSSCSANQTYIPPGSAYTAGPNAGQVTLTGDCQNNPTTNYVPWILGGAAVVLVVILIARR